MVAEEEVDLSPLKSEFEEFFSSTYKKHIYDLATNYPKKKSLNVDYADLERFSPELADELTRNPDIVIKAATEALDEMKLGMPEGTFKPHVRFFGLPDTGLMVENISSKDINKLISVRGVITKRAEVMHKVKIAFYKCSLCGATSKVPVTKKFVAPQVCDSCRRRALEMVEDESYFVDLQKAEEQELLERLRGGEPASHIELWFEDDLVNVVTPGDTLEVTGILRLKPPLKARTGGQTSQPQIYSRYLDVVHVKKMRLEFEELELTEEEEKQIFELSKNPHLVERIVGSIAPAIYGHNEVKEAIALQLFGGTKDKELIGGGKIRDDIHVLLIGDPGSGKTRVLLYAKDLAPKSIYVSGKSVSGVGLTASAERDELGDGGWTLKAGALVLASGGMAAIDEFEKIDPIERGALHESMETQTISVAKAGIVAQFKTKTAILAAANPKLGRFDPNKLPGEQFAIAPSLLSRFDLIFPVIDVMDEEQDSKLAGHILALHRNASKPKTDEKKPAIDTPPIDRGFLRKYIAYARRHIKPVLTPEAEEKLRDFYTQLRKQGQSTGAVPITPRQIEGLIRLSEASAKMRLSDIVEESDAEKAIKLVDYVLRNTMMDRSTGIIDIDTTMTGIPKSQRDRVSTVLDIVTNLQKEFDEVEINKVVEKAKEVGIDEIASRRIIEDLVSRGELYKPQHGYVRFVFR